MNSNENEVIKTMETKFKIIKKQPKNSLNLINRRILRRMAEFWITSQDLLSVILIRFFLFKNKMSNVLQDII